jgi:hypothetical protein
MPRSSTHFSMFTMLKRMDSRLPEYSYSHVMAIKRYLPLTGAALAAGLTGVKRPGRAAQRVPSHGPQSAPRPLPHSAEKNLARTPTRLRTRWDARATRPSRMRGPA